MKCVSVMAEISNLPSQTRIEVGLQDNANTAVLVSVLEQNVSGTNRTRVSRQIISYFYTWEQNTQEYNGTLKFRVDIYIELRIDEM